MPRTHAYDTVHELALDQHGVFTTAQAKDLGVHPKTLWAMANRDRIKRLSFGVYQDLGAPTTPWTQCMSAALWPQGVTGVLSHQTALSLMDLSDVNPARIHLTLPRGYRVRRRKVPAVLVLHWADLPEEDVGSVEGVPVTKAAHTIRDCAKAHIGPALLRQALEDGIRTGWLGRKEAQGLKRELMAGKYL
jgi:predicted transcriptional regulator of viral defense system